MKLLNRLVYILYCIYQLLVVLPIALVATILASITTIVGCAVGNGNFWGYWPGRIWSWIIIRVLLLPVKVERDATLSPNQSYVFVANHQGAFDIFLIYAFLGRNFKWMMKKSLRRIPLVGIACEWAHFVFVDRSTPSHIAKTLEQADAILRDGMSLVIFPEGSRTFTGYMGFFRRGAFFLADELQLPVVPLTIDGSFDVKPRTHDIDFVRWHRLVLKQHAPIFPQGKGTANINYLRDKSYRAIMDGLPENRRGYQENSDQ